MRLARDVGSDGRVLIQQLNYVKDAPKRFSPELNQEKYPPMDTNEHE
jgi:hypothetical protein